MICGNQPMSAIDRVGCCSQYACLGAQESCPAAPAPVQGGVCTPRSKSTGVTDHGNAGTSRVVHAPVELRREGAACRRNGGWDKCKLLQQLCATREEEPRSAQKYDCNCSPPHPPPPTPPPPPTQPEGPPHHPVAGVVDVASDAPPARDYEPRAALGGHGAQPGHARVRRVATEQVLLRVGAPEDEVPQGLQGHDARDGRRGQQLHGRGGAGGTALGGGGGFPPRRSCACSGIQKAASWNPPGPCGRRPAPRGGGRAGKRPVLPAQATPRPASLEHHLPPTCAWSTSTRACSE